MPLPLRTSLLAACLLVLACLLPSAASATAAAPKGGVRSNGGVGPDNPQFAPTGRATVVRGLAYAPADAPAQVVNAIAAANEIVRMHYRYGGGHGSFVDSAYDCSGSVSFALHGASLITAPLDSSSFMSWGLRGKGRWITIYSNPGHAFATIAGLRFDTGYRDRYAIKHGAAPGSGPRWSRPRPTRGFVARHPSGL